MDTTTRRSEDMTTPRHGRQAGFSLSELMVALVITLIVSGAIYGMLANSQNSFRREPEVSDRQQNIRVAMQTIAHDVTNAGADVPAWMQVFSDRLGNGALPDGAGPTGPNGATDIIQFYSSDGNCPNLTVCGNGGGSSITTQQLIPGCFGLPGPVLLWTSKDNPAWPCGGGEPKCSSCSQVQWGCTPGNGANNACGNGQSNGGNGHTVFPHGQSNLNPPGGPNFCPDGLSAIGVSKYEIRVDTDGVPNLWHTNLADITVNGGNPNCSNPQFDATAGWGMVARGVEDLQVEYLTQDNYASGAWVQNPPHITNGNWGDVVRMVRVTLGARTIQGRLQGQTTATSNISGKTAIRGQLTQEITPRPALSFLASASPLPLYR